MKIKFSYLEHKEWQNHKGIAHSREDVSTPLFGNYVGRPQEDDGQNDRVENPDQRNRHHDPYWDQHNLQDRDFLLTFMNVKKKKSQRRRGNYSYVDSLCDLLSFFECERDREED